MRQLLATASGVQRATTMPTEQELQALEAAPAALDREVGRLNAILTERLTSFRAALDEAGVPWTPGRPIR